MAAIVDSMSAERPPAQALKHQVGRVGGISNDLAGALSLLLVWSGFALADFTLLAVRGYLLVADLFILLAWFLAAGGRPILLWRREVTVPLLLLFSGTLLSSLLASADPRSSLITSFHVIFSLLFLSTAVATLVAKNLRYAWAAFFGAIAASLVRTVDILLMVPLGVQFATGSRAGGVLGLESLLILQPGLVACAIWGFERAAGDTHAYRSRLVATLYAVALVAGLVAVVMTRFRALWLAVLVALGAVIAFYCTRSRRFAVRAALVSMLSACLLVISLLAGFMPQFVQDRVVGITDSGATDIAARFAVLGDLLPRAEHNPLLGIGYNQSHLYTVWFNVHSWPLNMFVENGALSFLGLMLLPLGCLTLYLRARRFLSAEARLLVLWSGASLAGLGIASLVIANMYEHCFGLMLGVFVGVTGAAIRSRREDAATGADRVRLAYVITTLKEYGGAEAALMRIVPSLSPSVLAKVIVLKDEVPASILEQLSSANVEVIQLRLRPLSVPIALVRAERHLAAFAPDVVVSSLFHALVLSRVILPFLPGRPGLVSWQHNQRVGSRLRVGVTRLVARRVDMFLADSNATAQAVSRVLPLASQKMRVLDIAGIDTEEFRPAERRTESGTEVRIGSLGVLTSQKGYDVLLDALASLPSKTLDRLRVVIGGEGPRQRELETQLADLSLARRVTFVGVVEDAAAFLRDLDVYVQPSRWEGRCIAVVEAMATGLPIVASNVGGIGESVGDNENGLLVSPDAPEALAHAIETVAADEALRQRMGAESRRRAEVLPSTRDMSVAFERLVLSVASSRESALVPNEE